VRQTGAHRCDGPDSDPYHKPQLTDSACPPSFRKGNLFRIRASLLRPLSNCRSNPCWPVTIEIIYLCYRAFINLLLDDDASWSKWWAVG